MIEDMFDRIYHDLNPFWAVPANKIRADAAALPNFIRVRNGTVSRSPTKQPFMDSYCNLVKKIGYLLLDLDILINHMDEPRVLVPWTGIAEKMAILSSSLSCHLFQCHLMMQHLKKTECIYRQFQFRIDCTDIPRSFSGLLVFLV
jgi:hypothetical protein